MRAFIIALLVVAVSFGVPIAIHLATMQKTLTGEDISADLVPSYNRGIRAYKCGVPATANPYMGGGSFGGVDAKSEAWFQGWQDAKSWTKE